MNSPPRVIYSQERIKRLAQANDYKILAELVIRDYDHHWPKIIDRLASIKKPFYLPQEKYVVHHMDTEYFLGDIGFVIENFNRSIRALDIDPCRFVIFTNHRGSTESWRRYASHEKNQFVVIETPWTELLRDHRHMIDTISVPTFRYHFCAIMGASRCHRDKIANWIALNKLQHSNLVTYHKNDPQVPIVESIKTPNPVTKTGVRYLTTVPFTRVNEEWSNRSSFESSCDSLYNQEVSEFDRDHVFQSPWYREVMFDLVAETVFDYPYAYISEKTVRPIVHARPFVIVGAANTLSWLHEMGFKTFHKWWDERYDRELDPDIRLREIFSTVKNICSWSSDRCRQVFEEMIPILEHNQNIYKELAF